MAEAPDSVIHFHSDAVDDGTFLVTRLQVVESISQPYKVTMDVISKSSEIDGRAIWKNKAWVGLKYPVELSDGWGVKTRKWHGKRLGDRFCKIQKPGRLRRCIDDTHG